MLRIPKATILMGFMLLAWKLCASFINKSVLSKRFFFLSSILFQPEWSSNIEHNYNGFIINIYFLMTFQLEYLRQLLFFLFFFLFRCTIVFVHRLFVSVCVHAYLWSCEKSHHFLFHVKINISTAHSHLPNQ